MGPRFREDDDEVGLLLCRIDLSSSSRKRAPILILGNSSMERAFQPATYLLASQRRGTLYVGVTSDLVQRVWQHRHHQIKGFTDRYNVTMLVWYQLHPTMEIAIAREKAIKQWKRAWKLELIETANAEWRDLWGDISGGGGEG